MLVWGITPPCTFLVIIKLQVFLLFECIICIFWLWIFENSHVLMRTMPFNKVACHKNWLSPYTHPSTTTQETCIWKHLLLTMIHHTCTCLCKLHVPILKNKQIFIHLKLVLKKSMIQCKIQFLCLIVYVIILKIQVRPQKVLFKKCSLKAANHKQTWT